MTSPEPGVSLSTATAIALGAMKATAITKQVLRDVGMDKVPAQPKALTSTAFAIIASMLTEDGWRRQALTACASAGLAGMLHSTERLIRARGDIDRVIFFREAPKVGLRSRR